MKKNILFELNKRRWQKQKQAGKNNRKQFRNTLIKTNESGKEYSKKKKNITYKNFENLNYSCDKNFLLNQQELVFEV